MSKQQERTERLLERVEEQRDYLIDKILDAEGLERGSAERAERWVALAMEATEAADPEYAAQRAAWLAYGQAQLELLNAKA